MEPMDVDTYVVIMAGGAGTRFWPASLDARPKQLLPLLSDLTLLQESIARALAMVPADRILVVAGRSIELPIRMQAQLPSQNILIEPMRKDTAAAVALAALTVHKRSGDRAAHSTMIVLTADHAIAPTASLVAGVGVAMTALAEDPSRLFTFGIPPTHPATGYGYLDVGSHATTVQQVTRFVEKPDVMTAKSYIESGTFLWNSGMFIWRTATILELFARYLPAHTATLLPAIDASPSMLERAFAALVPVSVDKGIMEHAGKDGRVWCVPATFSWSDVGSFPSLVDHLPHDADNNSHRGRLAVHDAADNVVWSEDPEELIALVGVRDLVVVRSGKRTLVVPKDRAEDVKRLVAQLAAGDK
jgi:mannose-1-phosphate guanylyltransferase